MPRLQKTHYVTLRLKFDEPLPKRDAYKAARSIYEGGEYGIGGMYFDVVKVIGARGSGVR